MVSNQIHTDFSSGNHPMAVHNLLLDDNQKFAFCIGDKKVNVTKSVRHHRIKHKFDWAGSFIFSIEEARMMWSSLKEGGAVEI